MNNLNEANGAKQESLQQLNELKRQESELKESYETELKALSTLFFWARYTANVTSDDGQKIVEKELVVGEYDNDASGREASEIERFKEGCAKYSGDRDNQIMIKNIDAFLPERQQKIQDGIRRTRHVAELLRAKTQEREAKERSIG